MREAIQGIVLVFFPQFFLLMVGPWHVSWYIVGSIWRKQRQLALALRLVSDFGMWMSMWAYMKDMPVKCAANYCPWCPRTRLGGNIRARKSVCPIIMGHLPIWMYVTHCKAQWKACPELRLTDILEMRQEWRGFSSILLRHRSPKSYWRRW